MARHDAGDSAGLADGTKALDEWMFEELGLP